MPEIGEPATPARRCRGMRLLLRAAAAVLAVGLGACGGAGSPPTVTSGPPSASGSASPSASADPYCDPTGDLPQADAVADISLPARQHTVTIKVGQTVRVQAEQRCGGHQFNVVADDKGRPHLILVRSGGASQPGSVGTTWAIYRGVQPGVQQLNLIGGAWCPSGQPCPLYALTISQVVTVIP